MIYLEVIVVVRWAVALCLRAIVAALRENHFETNLGVNYLHKLKAIISIDMLYQFGATVLGRIDPIVEISTRKIASEPKFSTNFKYSIKQFSIIDCISIKMNKDLRVT